MVKTRLQDLSDEEIIRGIHLILENAKQLSIEADLLFSNKMFLRAYTLYQLGLEEVGKSRILFVLLLNKFGGKEIDWDATNSEFTDHKEKTKSAIVFEMIALHVMTYEDDELRKLNAEYWEYLHRQRDEVHISNDLKNNSLYVGIKENKFVSPKHIISPDKVDNLKANFNLRYEAASTLMNHFLPDGANNLKEAAAMVNKYEKSLENES